MRRKGNVPLLLLFIVALVLSVGTLFSFVSFDNEGFDKQSKELSEVIDKVDFSKKYVEESANLIGEEVARKGGDKEKYQGLTLERDLKLEGVGNFFGKIRTGQFEWVDSGDKYILKVDGLFVQSEEGLNKIKKNFDLNLEFEKKA